MVYLSKIYTKSGDKGSTRLVGGQEVPKDHPRIEAYGTVDELNCIVGMARTLIEIDSRYMYCKKDMIGKLSQIQQDLFNLGSDWATLPEDKTAAIPVIKNEDVTRLENWIDEFNTHLEPLNSFVLPGGDQLNSWLHIARTVCRRAERCAVALKNANEISPESLVYLNRLSDFFFVASRYVAKQMGEKEYLWEK